jgi:hypothetical protein
VPLALQRSSGGDNRLVASGVQLDGEDVRLILDTGSPHVVILSKTPRPHEKTIQAEDAHGEPLTLYSSTIEIAFNGGPSYSVTVDRAASFPALEDTVAALGNVVGLLGLDALGHDRIVISKDTLAFVR